MSQIYHYSSAAPATTLSSSLGSVTPGTTGSVVLVSITGLPALFPFTLIAEPGTSNAEVITVTQAHTGTGPFTFANSIRGDDGTSAPAHSGGAAIAHGFAARDAYHGTNDWINVWQSPYNADPTGTADSTSGIQAALNGAAAGQVVYAPAGSYKTTATLAIPAGVSLYGAAGWDAYDWGDTGTIFVPTAGLSGTAVISMTAAGTQAQGSQLRNFGIDGAALPATVDGIGASGDVQQTVIENVCISQATNWGIRCFAASGAHPGTWRVNHVRLRQCTNGGAFLNSHYDSTWNDVLALGCASGANDAFALQDCSNSHFTNVRAEWSGRHGFNLSGAWNTGTGSGGFTMTGCSTDRNDQNGVQVTATGTCPVILTGCMFRRDGRNGGTGGNSCAALNLSGATIPVTVNGMTCFPGVDDTGSGTSSPQYGVRMGTSSSLTVSSGYIQAATSALSITSGNTFFYAHPSLVVQATGTTASPSVASNLGHEAPWTPSDNGLLVSNGDPALYTANLTAAAGTVYLAKLKITSPVTITNLWWTVEAVGSGASTTSFAGLYSSAGTLLSGSSDIGSLFTSGGAVETALTTPQALLPGFVWAALVFNLASTQPTLFRGVATQTGATTMGLTASAYRWATNGTGATSLPSSITPGSNAATTATFWCGAS